MSLARVSGDPAPPLGGRRHNALAVGLMAMALHAGASLAFHWPYPSVATVLAGLLAIGWPTIGLETLAPLAGGLAGVFVLAPDLLPPPLIAAAGSALLARTIRRGENSLGDVAMGLPALAILLLALTF